MQPARADADTNKSTDRKGVIYNSKPNPGAALR